MQLSIANHLTDEIRRQNQDGVFVEGWALYGEEMLMRTGFIQTILRRRTNPAVVALSRRANRSRCKSAHGQMDVRAGGQIFYGRRRT